MLYYWPVDTLDLVLGRRDSMTPPRGKFPSYVVSGGFSTHGAQFTKHLIELGRLAPDGTILDLGCGIGRIAVPLTRYLNESGRYEGLDIVPESIAWCQEKITPRHPNFRFQLEDVYNRHYHPEGRQAAEQYAFPYDAETFDVLLLKSVFTHMLAADMRRYMQETARVLKSGGRAVITFFLLNKHSEVAMASGKAKRSFAHVFGHYRTESREDLEAAVAYDESFVRDLLTESGLEIEEPVHPGGWTGYKNARFAQDILVAIKKT